MFPGMGSMKGIIVNSWNAALTLKRGDLEGFFAFLLMRHGKKEKRMSDKATLKYSNNAILLLPGNLFF